MKELQQDKKTVYRYFYEQVVSIEIAKKAKKSGFNTMDSPVMFPCLYHFAEQTLRIADRIDTMNVFANGLDAPTYLQLVEWIYTIIRYYEAGESRKQWILSWKEVLWNSPVWYEFKGRAEYYDVYM